MEIKFSAFKRKQYIKKATTACFWSIVGTILPLILGSVILLTYSKSDKLIGFVDRGDFCLYSAGLLASALFILSDNKENIRKWHNSILYPATFLLIIISATLYCAIYIGGDLLKEQIKIEISNSFVRATSWILIICSLIITYRALIIDFKFRPPKVDAIRKYEENVENIKDQLGK